MMYSMMYSMMSSMMSSLANEVNCLGGEIGRHKRLKISR